MSDAEGDENGGDDEWPPRDPDMDKNKKVWSTVDYGSIDKLYNFLLLGVNGGAVSIDDGQSGKNGQKR